MFLYVYIYVLYVRFSLCPTIRQHMIDVKYAVLWQAVVGLVGSL